MLARLAGLVAVIAACAACQAQSETPARPAPGAPGAQCGGVASPPCAEGLYCKKAAKDLPVADKPGVCAAKPQMCPMIYQPVCGADSKTYPNACHAAQAGVNVAADGACAIKP